MYWVILLLIIVFLVYNREGMTTGRLLKQYIFNTTNLGETELQYIASRAGYVYSDPAALSLSSPLASQAYPDVIQRPKHASPQHLVLQQIVPSPQIAPIQLAPPEPVISIAERSDARCGPNFGDAKCGPMRCCSIYGWCGSQGEPHCRTGISMSQYNGVGAYVV